MRVAVLGLWHLGSVTAACLAQAGHAVIGCDPDESVVTSLVEGLPPVAEPGLADLVRQGQQAGCLRFTRSVHEAVAGADVIWVCFDTPVDDDDRADVGFVLTQVEAAFPAISDGAVVLVSSQLPVGSIRRLEEAWRPVAAGRIVSFSCSPENLRLGKAIEVFTKPDRVVVGFRDARTQAVVGALLTPLTTQIEWMSVESAEMTKHAINTFLATSVAFINELATLCELTGADAKEVERGLKTEQRIGPRAYFAPGGAVAGGTLIRDVMFLRALGTRLERTTPLLDGIIASNTAHRAWARHRIVLQLGAVDGARVAVWGLTYKPGTDTLRRLGAVELCRWLQEHGAQVRVHDPAVRDLPPDLGGITRVADPLQAAAGADVLVVATEWPEYRCVTGDALHAVMPRGVILDANRFLASSLGQDARFQIVSVGQPQP